MVLTALLMLPVIYYLAVLLLPAHFRLEGVRLNEDGIQAEIHGTPFKAGDWRVPAVQAIPKCLAVWRSSTISKTASSTKFYLICGQPPRLYIKPIPE